MKTLLSLLLLLPAISYSQSHSCCVANQSTQTFTEMAMTEAFAAAHLDPLPLDYTPASGTMIKYPCSDNKEANAFLVKSPKASNRWLIVIHEWWGLNDYIKRVSEKFQNELGDVNVLAVDLFDGKVAETAPVAQQILGEMKETRAQTILQGAINYAGKNAKIATIGWCVGGGWSLQASIMAGKNGSGCVMYYGMPEEDPAKIKKLNGDVLGIFAKRDGWITPAVVEKFKKNMADNGKKITVRSFDADHAFANPSNPKYDKASAEEANKLAIDFLKGHLK